MLGRSTKAMLILTFLFVAVFVASLDDQYRQFPQRPPDNSPTRVKHELLSFNATHCYIGISGYSLKSVSIYYCRIGNGSRTGIILGGLHGNEPQGTLVCLALLSRLSSLSDELEYTLVVVPLCNPDGAILFQDPQSQAQNNPSFGRYNADGVDLNRDFYDFTQPETQSIKRLLDIFRPSLLIDIHECRGNSPILIFGTNELSKSLSEYFVTKTNLPAAPAAEVGQSANYASHAGMAGMILELPRNNDLEAGTSYVWQLIQCWVESNPQAAPRVRGPYELVEFSDNFERNNSEPLQQLYLGLTFGKKASLQSGPCLGWQKRCRGHYSRVP